MKIPVRNAVKIGEGGFADVYVGNWTANNARVVAKVLREAQEQKYRDLFAREVRVLRRAVHRGVMPILFADLNAPNPYYLMPYAEGGDMSGRAGRLTDEQLIASAIHLAEAIEALHAHSIVHGDIKPPNLLVMKHRLKVSDPLGNGAGCTISFGTKWGGTPGYMASEIEQMRPISKAGDVYSFGATLFHLATGVHPHGQPELGIVAPDGRKAIGRLDAVIKAACRSDPRQRPSIRKLRVALVQLRDTMFPKPAKQAIPTDGLAALALFLFGTYAVGKLLSKR